MDDSPDFYPWLQPLVNKIVDCEKQTRLPHAWVFYGQAGVGKTGLVYALSKQILAPGGIGSDALSKQAWVDADTHPDFKIIRPTDKGNIGVDTVREAIDFLSHTPLVASNKILVILQAEKMQVAAQSALLKTLEEPLGKAYVFLTTERVTQLLPTLMSRCQRQAVALPSEPDLEAWFKEKQREFKQPITETDLFLAKKLANHSPGLMLFLLSETPLSSEDFKKSLPLLLYLLGVVISQWEPLDGIKAFVEKRMGVTLPDFVFSPQSIKDKQRKIELYRKVCHLAEKARSFSGLNVPLLIHSIEHFDFKLNKRTVQ